MKEFGDLEDLPVLDLHLFAHSGKAAGADLEIRHADRILVGHAERELPRGFGQQPAGAVAPSLLDILEAPQPCKEVARISVS